jgi:hypothetical protein
MSEVLPENMNLTHDMITRWLTSAKVQPKDLWEVSKKEIAGRSGILLFDDVVIDKSRSVIKWNW